ncbi:hypothetical protein SteCoe_36929 [Stentor coeruleus]|uniref:Uncharacterized protein n=1 Tax=Stentor coeruleus TaxID=5963 RepID=A0A1R2APG0_9CILI|nr:hypothetical protein SteCoe_36929 [Stentor coeruleus]
MIILCLAFVLIAAQQNTYYIPPVKSPPSGRIGSSIAFIPSKNALFIFGGSLQTTYYDELWSFQLEYNIWEEVLLSTDSSPSPRIYFGSFVSALSDRFYIFGGNSYQGLKNDFWEFDHINFKWTYLDTINPPSARHAFSFTSFVKDGNEIFVIFGGESKSRVENNLFILNMTTLEWHEMVNYGIEMPGISHNSMGYYKGCIYMTNG